MSTPDIERKAREREQAADGAGERRAAAAPRAAAEPGPGVGAEASRRRGALLRRVLAFGDWAALAVTLMVVTAASAENRRRDPLLGDALQPQPGSSSSSSTASTTTTTAGSATAPSTRCPRWSRPASSAPSSSTACWRSARSARWSRSQAIAVGVGTLVGSFFCRGVIRFFWHRLTPLAPGLAIGAAARRRHGRPPRLDPPRDPPGAGRLPLRRRGRDGARAAAAGLDLRHRRGRRRATRSSASSSPNRR